MEADGGLMAQGNITLKNSCNLIFDLADSYGDGWNGANLTVSFDDGTPSQNLTMTSGSTASYTIEVNNGVHVTLTWSSGSWDSECSFTVKYEDGTQIYQVQGPSAGVLYQFDANCSGSSAPITVEPVHDLTGEVEGFFVTLYWNTSFLRDDMVYHIMRNGIEIGQTTENSYTDEVHVEMVYTYCVVAEFEGSYSAPECILIEFVDGMEEMEAEFSVYPNPVNSTLNINGGNAEFSYVLFNGMGQTVAKGNAQGNSQINVIGMEKGVYFLRLTSGTQVRIEKVVVE